MISFVCGQLCSGKTLYSKALAETSNGVYIEVGDIVRSLKLTSDRKALQDSKELAEIIIERLQTRTYFGGDFVISGVRQQKILEAFPQATLLWIEAPASVREQRYLKRDRTGDSQTFEQAEQGDIDLGILEVKQYIFSR
jgi:cytidylate kinase